MTPCSVTFSEINSHKTVTLPRHSHSCGVTLLTVIRDFTSNSKRHCVIPGTSVELIRSLLLLHATMNCPDPKVDGRMADVGNKRKKTVCFAPDLQVCGDETLMGGMSESERFHGWWQQDEYEGRKSSARSLCRKMRRMGGGSSLSDAYDRACSIAASGIDLEAVHADQVLIPNEVSDGLNS